MIADNIARVRESIKQAALRGGRRPEDVTLVCVTKGRPMKDIEEALACGVTDIGENRVQEAFLKHRELSAKRYPLNAVKWHLVGHLQTNKVKEAVAIFDLIHSVDSLKLAKEIDKQASRTNKIQEVLLEVNTSGEKSKYGFKPQELIQVISDMIILNNVNVRGLMTMAPVVRNKEETRRYFRMLRELKDKVNAFLPTINYRLFSVLSMGMTQDYEVAIEEGATIIRIGTAVFEG
jgi:pyridoxal phosphate enzyme (YggS family)